MLFLFNPGQEVLGRNWGVSNGFCGDGSFLQAPLTPDTQGVLTLHLGRRILRRHQGLCSCIRIH